MKRKKKVFCVRIKKEIKHEKVSFFLLFFFSCEVLFLVRELRARESSWRGSTGDYWSKARQRELAIPYIHQFSSRSRLRTVHYRTVQSLNGSVRGREGAMHKRAFLVSRIVLHRAWRD